VVKQYRQRVVNIDRQGGVNLVGISKKRSLLEPVLQQFSQKIKDVQIEKMTARIFRKLLKEYGFKIVRSNDQYFVYPK